jgi:hypothetical protein
MSIDQPDKIDLLITDKDKTHVLLVITDHLDWEEFDVEFHLELLQDKLNAYLHFIEDGELIRMRPDLKGLPITIRVDAKYPPSGEATDFYRQAGPLVTQAGASLELYLPLSETKTRF